MPLIFFGGRFGHKTGFVTRQQGNVFYQLSDHLLPIAQHQCPFEDVLELPDVSGPRVFGQPFDDAAAGFEQGLVVKLGRIAFDIVIDQRGGHPRVAPAAAG